LQPAIIDVEIGLCIWRYDNSSSVLLQKNLVYRHLWQNWWFFFIRFLFFCFSYEQAFVTNRWKWLMLLVNSTQV